ncbi:MAG: SDR family oxidoreductase [Solirubrobacteraceae bacterium]|jgi:NAD(P)-dependent dehydrogenase (short-subunit alcohol dehydrogenase family)
MDLQLEGKRAIVTGASRGIGLAAAGRLAAEGADVVIAARTAEDLAAAAKSIANGGGRVLPIAVDTTNDASVRALVDQTVQQLGGVDILVNAAASAGVGTRLPLERKLLADTTDEDFWSDVNTKVVGYLRTARAVAPHLIAQRWGRIINVSGLGARQTHSIVGTVRNVGVAALTKNLADELGPYGINATVVHPGATLTERVDAALTSHAQLEGIDRAELERRLAERASIGRIVTSAEVANVIAFLSSPLSVAITGDAIPVGGGQRGVVHY